MAAIRTFLKRIVGQHSSNNNSNPRTTIDSSSDTLSSTTTDRLNTHTNDGYSSTSTLGVLINNNDDSLRHPLLNTPSRDRRWRFLLRLINNSTIMNTQQEQFIEENICLFDKKLPKELILRIIILFIMFPS